MIYIKRLLWAAFYIPALLIATYAFGMGLFLHSIILCAYYIKDGTTIYCNFAPNTIADAIHNFYLSIRPK